MVDKVTTYTQTFDTPIDVKPQRHCRPTICRPSRVAWTMWKIWEEWKFEKLYGKPDDGRPRMDGIYGTS